MRLQWVKQAGPWALGLALLALGGLSAQPASAEVMANNKCLKCHGEFKKMGDVVAGDFQSRSGKAKSISVLVAPGKNIIVKFTPETTVTNVPNIKALKKPIPVLVKYQKQGSDLVATAIVAKPQIKVPEKQIMGVKELAALVAQGPAKGKYTLVDSRPPIRYFEGHIPGAVMMPFPKMPEMMGKLPKDKNQLIVFYCQGFRWVLSPMAARMAEKNGYTNVKVFHAGLPAWKKAGLPVVTTNDFVKKRLGYIVVIDTRGVAAAKKGHIQGAVAIPRDKVIAEREQFPLDRKAYIVLYSDQTDLDRLSKLTKEIGSWGYGNVAILRGGFSGWQKAGGPIQRDLVSTKIFYLPRPHPGEITGDEFINIVRNQPKGKLILDVRTKAESAAGMLPGAVNIPVDELSARVKELPKDKEIITHCRTGLRAEMGYNILRNAGYNARFLNDKVTILQNKVFCCYK